MGSENVAFQRTLVLQLYINKWYRSHNVGLFACVYYLSEYQLILSIENVNLYDIPLRGFRTATVLPQKILIVCA